jgi:hypothetical protein
MKELPKLSRRYHDVRKLRKNRVTPQKCTLKRIINLKMEDKEVWKAVRGK